MQLVSGLDLYARISEIRDLLKISDLSPELRDSLESELRYHLRVRDAKTRREAAMYP